MWPSVENIKNGQKDQMRLNREITKFSSVKNLLHFLIVIKKDWTKPLKYYIQIS